MGNASEFSLTPFLGTHVASTVPNLSTFQRGPGQPGKTLPGSERQSHFSEHADSSSAMFLKKDLDRKGATWGVWVAQSVKPLTLAGYDLTVREFEPPIVVSKEPALDSLPAPLLCAFPMHMLTQNKLKKGGTKVQRKSRMKWSLEVLKGKLSYTTTGLMESLLYIPQHEEVFLLPSNSPAKEN